MGTLKKKEQANQGLTEFQALGSRKRRGWVVSSSEGQRCMEELGDREN